MSSICCTMSLTLWRTPRKDLEQDSARAPLRVAVLFASASAAARGSTCAYWLFPGPLPFVALGDAPAERGKGHIVTLQGMCIVESPTAQLFDPAPLMPLVGHARSISGVQFDDKALICAGAGIIGNRMTALGSNRWTMHEAHQGLCAASQRLR